VNTNLALLQATRAANPNAAIIYKPHPDVEAGLRAGAVSDSDLDGLADAVVVNADIAALLDQVQEVWTMTSLTGFEALMRGIQVTCLGTPFYAGWGLTRDLGKVPARRGARPTLEGLVHATLIDYPRYLDPVCGLPCPVEVIVERLASGEAGGGLHHCAYCRSCRVFSPHTRRCGASGPGALPHYACGEIPPEYFG